MLRNSLFFCLGVLVVFSTEAVQASAQSIRLATQSTKETTDKHLVTARYKDTPIALVLKDIVGRTGINISYTKDQLVGIKPVNATFNHSRVAEVLEQLLKGSGIQARQITSNEWTLAFKKQSMKVVGQGAIVGKATDAKTGKGVSGATVSVENGTRGILTGEDGSYRLIGVVSGQHTVTVRLVGYAKQVRQVVVSEGGIAIADFKLEPTASVLNEVVVTGTVISTELKAVPNAITVITAKQIEEKGITRIDQLFRGDIPGLFSANIGSASADALDEVMMFSRGATALSGSSVGTTSTGGHFAFTNPIKTYIDGVELANPYYLSQIDPRSIERIEILSGPQASTIYGSNAINGVMQIFTKRGNTSRPQVWLNLISGVAQNNSSASLTPSHSGDIRVSGIEGRLSYNSVGAIDYTGSWTPGTLTTRYSGSGGIRMEFGKLVTDASIRHQMTKNSLKGTPAQGDIIVEQNGLAIPNGSGVPLRTDYTLVGQTFGFSVNFTPLSWWSHELVLGSDKSESDDIQTSRKYTTRSDTLLSLRQQPASRISQRYTTTTMFPLGTLAKTTVAAGMDHWRSQSSYMSSSTPTLTGTISNPLIIRSKPEKNAGGFIQSQISFTDALFLTYGLRAEWNPNFGDNEQPNFAPRYGFAYTREFGAVTGKLRGSYGRSTRPPARSLKDGVAANLSTYGDYFGQFDITLGNPDLGPEYQQGGEGGLELYFSNRGSLVVTRYNQTVDALISSIVGADSIRSINPDPFGLCAVIPEIHDAECHYWQQQTQYLNVGSIRNQGWELQGSVNVGPLTTHGTYSWTKSRVIGINPRYSHLLTNSEYQPGRPFNFIPEHTWALNFRYVQAKTTVSLGVNGLGQIYPSQDELYYVTGGVNNRVISRQFRIGLPSGYRSINKGYATSDLNASHRFSSRGELLLQIHNLTNYYQNDFGSQFVSIGRQSKLGLRLKIN